MEQDKCSRCRKCARIDESEYCSRCLVEVIEKRASKKLNSLGYGSGRLSCGRISIVCDSKESLSCAVAAYLAKKACKAAAVPVIRQESLRSKSKSKTQQPHTAVIMPKCADETATTLVEKFTNSANKTGSRGSVISYQAEVVNIFESVTEKELELYATIKKIKYAKGKTSESSDLKQKIQKLQARYPGTIEALAQAGRQIEKI